MTTKPSERDRRDAGILLGRIAGNVITAYQSENRAQAEAATTRAEDTLARALAARSAVPDGHVRLSDGREPKVTNTEALSEAIKQPAMCAECGTRPKVGLNWCSECCEVIARRAIAAAAAARGGER